MNQISGSDINRRWSELEDSPQFKALQGSIDDLRAQLVRRLFDAIERVSASYWAEHGEQPMGYTFEADGTELKARVFPLGPKA